MGERRDARRRRVAEAEAKRLPTPDWPWAHLIDWDAEVRPPPSWSGTADAWRLEVLSQRARRRWRRGE